MFDIQFLPQENKDELRRCDVTHLKVGENTGLGPLNRPLAIFVSKGRAYEMAIPGSAQYVRCAIRSFADWYVLRHVLPGFGGIRRVTVRLWAEVSGWQLSDDEIDKVFSDYQFDLEPVHS